MVSRWLRTTQRELQVPTSARWRLAVRMRRSRRCQRWDASGFPMTREGKVSVTPHRWLRQEHRPRQSGAAYSTVMQYEYYLSPYHYGDLDSRVKCFVDCDECQLKASPGEGNGKLCCMFSGGGEGASSWKSAKVAEIVENIRTSRRKCNTVVPAVRYFFQRSYSDQTMG